MSNIKFTEEELIKFVDDWKPIKKKYFYNIENEVPEMSIYNKIWNCLYVDSNTCVSKEKMNKVYKTVNQVYFNNKSEKYMHIIESVFNKFIYQFVNIDGIDILFDSKYFNMEWQMHFDFDFEKYMSIYYRDHYLHQVRNMFEMIKMIEELNIEEYCIDWFSSKNTSIVCDYIRSLLEYDVYNMPSKKYKLYKDLVYLNLMDDNCRKKINDLEKNNGIDNSKTNKEIINNYYEKYILNQLFHELIYSTVIISSLVHDIGYPLSFLLKSNKNVSRYVPNSISFIKEINNIEYLDSKLKDTLLLKVVGIKEIVKGLEKYDHGVLSAIILLLFYYDNGKIYSLSKTEKAIIELSSLIIYNHTIKYKNQEEKRAEYDYVKNIFVKNPLSYIFRLCDDIQEWDRVYFENTRESNYTICNNCKTPLVRKYSNYNLKENSNKELKKIEYSCMCNSENTYNLRANEYRKTINVICCKEVDINYKELNNNSESGIPRNKEIVFKYDLFSLLEVAKYNVGYADIRAKEIKKIKIALSEQNDLYNTYVDFFMSNNPVELKLEILRRYLKKNTGIKNCQELLGSLPFNNNGSVLVKKINEIIKKRFEIYYNLVDLINKIDSNKKEEFLKKLIKLLKKLQILILKI